MLVLWFYCCTLFFLNSQKKCSIAIFLFYKTMRIRFICSYIKCVKLWKPNFSTFYEFVQPLSYKSMVRTSKKISDFKSVTLQIIWWKFLYFYITIAKKAKYCGVIFSKYFFSWKMSQSAWCPYYRKERGKCASLFTHFWCLKMVCQCTLSGGIRIILWFWSHWKLGVLMTLHCVLWTIFPSNLNLNAQAGCHKGTDFYPFV